MTEHSRAFALARIAHYGQVDHGGRSTFDHVCRVADRLQSDRCKTVALLHDIIEDTVVTVQDLMNMGFSSSVVHSVVVLTRVASETYQEYIERVKTSDDGVSILVKLADLDDHLEDTSAISESLIQRYREAKEYLS